MDERTKTEYFSDLVALRDDAIKKYIEVMTNDILNFHKYIDGLIVYIDTRKNYIINGVYPFLPLDKINHFPLFDKVFIYEFKYSLRKLMGQEITSGNIDPLNINLYLVIEFSKDGNHHNYSLMRNLPTEYHNLPKLK
jgi:hypothetical protein